MQKQYKYNWSIVFENNIFILKWMFERSSATKFNIVKIDLSILLWTCKADSPHFTLHLYCMHLVFLVRWKWCCCSACFLWAPAEKVVTSSNPFHIIIMFLEMHGFDLCLMMMWWRGNCESIMVHWFCWTVWALFFSSVARDHVIALLEAGLEGSRVTSF